MGQVILPSAGNVYLDTVSVIYSVERHADFWPLMLPVWSAAAQGQSVLVSSELLVLETLVGPYKTGNSALVAAYERALSAGDLRLLPLTQPVMREAARLRATTFLKTPDALHAATALIAECTLFITNDQVFRRVPSLPVVMLSDLL